MRAEDTVARPGGDEFTILLYDISSPGDAGAVAEKILARLRAPITISGHHLVVTTSIGITIIPSDSVQPNILTKNADLAMYRAKERGRNNYQYFAEEMNTKAQSRLRTENELREALEVESVRTVLSAESAARRPTHHRRRGADPLAASGTRIADARQIHQRRRRDRRHRRHRRVGHPTGVHCRARSDRADRRADSGGREHLARASSAIRTSSTPCDAAFANRASIRRNSKSKSPKRC